MEKENEKYTIKQILRYLKNNQILLVNGEEIGEIKLPEIDENFILDVDADGSITE